MNHLAMQKLDEYLRRDPDDFSVGDLKDYIWLVEQLLQELRQRVLECQNVKPLPPFTRP